ncbi:DUF2917 domain-containing protein [Paraburkholderia kururiensis]|uniref:DUF2917 domain-containing protein n=1 Tax=Paraburkholderia kururiensis TaxID=984307 RepID=A0ABZ0WE40_9BURK|nr:DUF2917 domain-containing protein [Paraburkholderia kururiensis]WQD75615.1 DUF2917 domain-containing protein [Paraburkholderia kururiensis]
MREIRTFELEHGEPAAALQAAQPLVLDVRAGQIWLTVEGDAGDYWLAAGESFELPRGARAWVSSGRDGARFALAFDLETARGGAAHAQGIAPQRMLRSWASKWSLARFASRFASRLA